MKRQMVLASAGTGKTFRVAGQIREWLLEGVPGSSIVATTFTNKAAAELRDRVPDRILYPENLDRPASDQEAARALEETQDLRIATVHGLGLQAIEEEYGLLGFEEPPIQLQEQRAERLFARGYEALDSTLLSRTEDLHRRFGQAGRLREFVREIANLAVQNALSAEDVGTQILAECEAYLEELGPVVPSESLGSLQAFVRRLLEETTIDEGTAFKRLQPLRPLVVDPRYWRYWRKLHEDDDRKGIAESPFAPWLRTVLKREELHADLRTYYDGLAAIVPACMEAFQRAKRQSNLVDFADMEALFLQLLRNPKSRWAEGVTHLVVDEFQDTNPIQLALFEELSKHASTTLYVGDIKQSIYGFRGSDVDLVQRTLASVPEDAREELGTSYRSSPAIVDFANQFVQEQQLPGKAIDAARKDSEGIVRWVPFEGVDKAEKFDCIARQVEAIRQGFPNESVGVLVHTNQQALDALQVLWARGIPASGATKHLAKTIEARILLHALACMADPPTVSDAGTRYGAWASAAALHMLLRDGDESNERLIAFVENPLVALSHTQGLPDAEEGICELIERIILHFDLPAWLQKRQGGPARVANLHAIRLLAANYVRERFQEGLPATLAGFLAWVKLQQADGKDERSELDAPVQVLTVYRSKGLEWDHVVYLDAHRVRDRGFNVRVRSESVHDDPLQGRHLHLRIWPFGMHQGSATGLRELRSTVTQADRYLEAEREAQEEAKRLAYVAITRPRRTLTLGLPKSGRFSHAFAAQAWREDQLPGAWSLDVKEALRVHELPAAKLVKGTPLRRKPSEELEGTASFHARQSWSPVPFDRGMLEDNEWGTVVHAWFASPRPRNASEYLRTYAPGATCSGLEEAHARWWTFLRELGGHVYVEANLGMPLPDGSVFQGQVDVLVELEDEVWVFDHKSSQGNLDGFVMKHAGQIQAYVQMAQASFGKPARGFLHYWAEGKIVELRFD